ncbi:MAG TPA: glycosyltransferase family 2 protein [Tepidisphaeraceae bacterium]|jgi:GT2 family glycosyltransferase|nr:glycosyltransferase family 2 protein [Tepidisphaeraceae bacterium]
MYVVIPAYKAPQRLEKCLAALRAQTAPVQVYVHDNSAQNIGFTAAVNVGLKRALKSGDEFALVLNQDVYLRPDGIEKLTAFMRSHPRCAIAGVKQFDDKDADIVQHGGCGAAYPYGAHIRGRKSQGDCAVSLPMPWVNGAIMAARLEAVTEFGLMDQNMFLIGSDSDWCYTARLRGWEVWYCAEVEVIHEGGVTCGAPVLELQPGFLRDMTYWRDKWVGTKVFERLKNWYPMPQ